VLANVCIGLVSGCPVQRLPVFAIEYSKVQVNLSGHITGGRYVFIQIAGNPVSIVTDLDINATKRFCLILVKNMNIFALTF
jgi:hypothetical protein